MKAKRIIKKAIKNTPKEYLSGPQMGSRLDSPKVSLEKTAGDRSFKGYVNETFRKAVQSKEKAKTQEKPKVSFDQAFAAARKDKKEIFDWNGKKYNTKLKEETKSNKKSSSSPQRMLMMKNQAEPPVGGAAILNRLKEQSVPEILKKSAKYVTNAPVKVR